MGLVLGLSLVLAFYALGWPSIAYHRPDMPTDLDAALRFERDPTTMGLQTGGEYRIRTVRELPPPESGPGIDQPRLNDASLPVGARVVNAEYDWSHYTVVIDSPQPFQVIFRTFDFPGWWAAINGQHVPITPTDPYGLISLAVPAGRQQVEVGFGPTPIRTAAAGVSLASVVTFVGLFLWIAPRRRKHELNLV